MLLVCHLCTFSCQCFSPGITEMPTIPASTILPLTVILPFFSTLVLFHSSFSQLSIFLRSLSQDYTTMLYQKQTALRGPLGERWHTSDTGRLTLVRKASMFLSRKDEMLFIRGCRIARFMWNWNGQSLTFIKAKF